jgi:hypothetical protein
VLREAERATELRRDPHLLEVRYHFEPTILDVVAVTGTLSIRTTTDTEDEAAAVLVTRTGPAYIISIRTHQSTRCIKYIKRCSCIFIAPEQDHQLEQKRDGFKLGSRKGSWLQVGALRPTMMSATTPCSHIKLGPVSSVSESYMSKATLLDPWTILD